MNTNSVTGLDLVPGLNLLPSAWQGPIVAIIVILGVFVPLAGRAWHGWTYGGGLAGVKNALLFGTNVPKTQAPAQPAPPVTL